MEETGMEMKGLADCFCTCADDLGTRGSDPPTRVEGGLGFAVFVLVEDGSETGATASASEEEGVAMVDIVYL